MINGKQVRAARALLGLSQAELANTANIGIATLQRLENTGDEVKGSARTIWKLQTALENSGIQFIQSDSTGGIGVRLKTPSKD